MEATEVISIREKREVQKLLVPFQRHAELTEMLGNYLGTACDIPEADVEPLRQIILDKINLMDECVSNVENLKEIAATNPSAVNAACTRTLSGSRLTPAEYAYWEKLLENQGDAAGLATFMSEQLPEIVPEARQRLQEMLRRIEDGQLPQGDGLSDRPRDPDARFACGAMIFTAIVGGVLGGPGGWIWAYAFAIGAAAYCAEHRVFG